MIINKWDHDVVPRFMVKFAVKTKKKKKGKKDINEICNSFQSIKIAIGFCCCFSSLFFSTYVK
jgi:hypothetical protein